MGGCDTCYHYSIGGTICVDFKRRTQYLKQIRDENIDKNDKN
jgi:hypothetical protein